MTIRRRPASLHEHLLEIGQRADIIRALFGNAGPQTDEEERIDILAHDIREACEMLLNTFPDAGVTSDEFDRAMDETPSNGAGVVL